MKTSFRVELRCLVVAGLLAAAPAVGFAQQKAGQAPVSEPQGKSISEPGVKGSKRTEALVATPPDEAGKSISSKGVQGPRKTEASSATLATTPESARSISEKGVK